MLTFPGAQSSVVPHVYALSPGKLICIHSLVTTCTHMMSPVYISSSVLLSDLQTGIPKCLLDWSSRMSESLLRFNLLPKPGPVAAFPISVDWRTILPSGTQGSFDTTWVLPHFETCFWEGSQILLIFFVYCLLPEILGIHPLFSIFILTMLPSTSFLDYCSIFSSTNVHSDLFC